jgi:hypothetical protein
LPILEAVHKHEFQATNALAARCVSRRHPADAFIIAAVRTSWLDQPCMAHSQWDRMSMLDSKRF